MSHYSHQTVEESGRRVDQDHTKAVRKTNDVLWLEMCSSHSVQGPLHFLLPFDCWNIQTFLLGSFFVLQSLLFSNFHHYVFHKLQFLQLLSNEGYIISEKKVFINCSLILISTIYIIYRIIQPKWNILSYFAPRHTSPNRYDYISPLKFIQVWNDTRESKWSHTFRIKMTVGFVVTLMQKDGSWIWVIHVFWTWS